MQCSLQCSPQLNCRFARPCGRRQQLQRLQRVASQSGRTEPFNEGAVQVKRLVDRDRQQMLGNKIDILDQFETEFGDPDDDTAPQAAAAAAASSSASASTSASTSATSTSNSSDDGAAPAPAPAATAAATATAAPPAAASPASPFAASPAAAAAAAKPAAVQTKFGGGAGPASPFGGASNPRQPRSMMEPKGLSPDMSPDPIVKMAPTPGNLLSKITVTQVVLFCTFSSAIGLMLLTFQVVLKSGAVRLAGIE